MAVRADLERWGIAEDTGLAASALDLAARLSVPDIRPAAASMLHAQLRATLAELAKLAKPEAESGDPVDELQKRREDRRKGA
ncbi:hypothetical protein [Thermoactinospora rubra]|uniref:hypothetical protein n=1 Tax=Thermoactinospora rubra TaxID=1088767 RepID=UPI00117E7D49|nr:hypothetical protein [Thermoactinospora rubra]